MASTNFDSDAARLALDLWSTHELRAMDDAFVAAMKLEGHEITEPSSRPGTRSPIAGYRREDW